MDEIDDLAAVQSMRQELTGSHLLRIPAREQLSRISGARNSTARRSGA